MKRLILVLLFVIAASTPIAAQPKLRVMLDFFPNPNHVPLIIAQRMGFFADEGLEVEIIVPANPSDP